MCLLRSSETREQPTMYKTIVLVLVLVVCLHEEAWAFPGWIKCGGGHVPAFLFRCCGGIPYSNSHMVGRSCCGKHTYVREIELCCNDVVHHQSKDEFCCGNKLMYNQITERCCKNRVIAKTESNAAGGC